MKGMRIANATSRWIMEPPEASRIRSQYVSVDFRARATRMRRRARPSDDPFVGVRDLAQDVVSLGPDPEGVLRAVRSPTRIVDTRERFAQALAPRVADHRKVRIGVVDANDLVAAQGVDPVNEKVNRQPDGEIRLERRVDRHERALGRLGDRRARYEQAIENRFSVFRFPDLEVARLRGGFDEVARGIDEEES